MGQISHNNDRSEANEFIRLVVTVASTLLAVGAAFVVGHTKPLTHLLLLQRVVGLYAASLFSAFASLGFQAFKKERNTENERLRFSRSVKVLDVAIIFSFAVASISLTIFIFHFLK